MAMVDARTGNWGFGARGLWRRGQAMVEFALVLPFLIFMFLGITELGFVLNDYLALVSANADAAKYGMRLHGNPDASHLIIDKFIENRGHLVMDNVDFTTSHGIVMRMNGVEKSASGALVNSSGNQVNISADNFYFWDNDTPDNLADDVPISCMNIRASYVKLTTRYRHQILVPGLNIITTGDEFPLDIVNVYPISGMDFGSTVSAAGGGLQGGFPITILDFPFVVGQSYDLKGKADMDVNGPGNFGWVNLDPAQAGNKNSNIVSWIRGPSTPTVSLPGWLGGFTGQRNSADIKAAIAQYSGKYIAILIHDQSQGNGANLQYHETAIAIFKCETFGEEGTGGNAYLTISGEFVRRISL